MQKHSTKPKHLSPISKEHHFGLLFCWKIQEGIRRRVDTNRISRYVQTFWADKLEPHFIEEETLLFVDKSDALVQEAVEQHTAIRAQVQTILKGDNISTRDLQTLTDQLGNHIRFEEHALFPHLEKNLTPAQLSIIDTNLHDTSSVQLRNNYPDEFWRDPNSSL